MLCEKAKGGLVNHDMVFEQQIRNRTFTNFWNGWDEIPGGQVLAAHDKFDDMVDQMSVKMLKAQLIDRRISLAGILEKNELRQKLKLAAKHDAPSLSYSRPRPNSSCHKSRQEAQPFRPTLGDDEPGGGILGDGEGSWNEMKEEAGGEEFRMFRSRGATLAEICGKERELRRWVDTTIRDRYEPECGGRVASLSAQRFCRPKL